MLLHASSKSDSNCIVSRSFLKLFLNTLATLCHITHNIYSLLPWMLTHILHASLVKICSMVLKLSKLQHHLPWWKQTVATIRKNVAYVRVYHTSYAGKIRVLPGPAITPTRLTPDRHYITLNGKLSVILESVWSRFDRTWLGYKQQWAGHSRWAQKSSGLAFFNQHCVTYHNSTHHIH